MNFVEKFDRKPAADASTSDSDGGFRLRDSVEFGGADGSASTVKVPDAHLLFSGDFKRAGNDLVISDAHHKFTVSDYFRGQSHPVLVSPDGATLDGKVVDALTGHAAYAQAAPAAPAGKVIGHVVKLGGSASVVRNGVTVELNVGDNVYQGDLVQTGSATTLGLVLNDGTTFNLTANARIMLDSLVYEAGGTANSALITLVQGAASFVAGQVAKTGDMKVGTPVATLGIRGTAVILDISSTDGKVSISVADQHDNSIHTVQVFNRAGNLIGTVTSNGSSLTLTPTATFDVIAQESGKSPADVQKEFATFQSLLSIYDAGKQMIPGLPDRGDLGTVKPTKYAGSGAIPDAPHYTFDTTGGTPTLDKASVPVTVTVTSIDPGTGGTTAHTTPAISVVTTAKVDVPAAPLPFVVGAPQISLVSLVGDSFGPVMSADGQFVTFDPDGAIFLYDRATGKTATITSADTGFFYTAPTISADGRFIVYQGTKGGQSFVFLYNNDPGDTANYQHTTQLHSGEAPAISGDGGIIVIENGGSSIGLYDQSGHTIAEFNPASVGFPGASVWKPSISADGNIVTFWAGTATPADAGQLFVFDRAHGTITAIGSTASGAGATAASVSADGRLITFQSDSGSGTPEIFLYDREANQGHGGIVFSTAAAAGGSYHPVISPDGNFIIFASDAKLTAEDTNSFADIYVADVSDPAHPVFKLVSALADGTLANGASNAGAAISLGGVYVAFGSSATNFVTNDTNGSASDIFVVDAGQGRSGLIQENAHSPEVLQTSGIIALTGGSGSETLQIAPSDVGTFQATIDPTDGAIHWTYTVDRSAFGFLSPGQTSVQNITINLVNGSGTLAIPVVVSVHDTNQPTVVAQDIAPVALPVTLAPGTEDTSYTITAAALLAGVTDIDGPSLAISSVSIQSGGGSLIDNHDGTWSYTPAANYNGPVQFSYTASDGSLSAKSTAGLILTAVNDAPTISATSGTLTKLPATGQTAVDTASGMINFSDVDLGDHPAVTTSFTSFSYVDAQHHDITLSLTPQQLASILAVEASLTLVPASDNTNNGSAAWTYSVADYKLDFLPAGDTLTLNYSATVDDGHGGVATTPLTLTIQSPFIAKAPTLSVGSSSTLAPTDGSAIKTTVALHAGDVLSFDWNFVGHDYLPFNDFSFATINGATYLLGLTQAVGDFGSTGWKTFTYTATTDGNYTLGIGEFNVNDTLLNSHTFVDNFRINGSLQTSFENTFSPFTTSGAVSVTGALTDTASGADNSVPIAPTDGSQMLLLDSAPISSSTGVVESFLGLATGSIAAVATHAGPEHTPIVVPISVTTSPSDHPDSVYATIAGFPPGSIFNHGTFDSQTNTWRVDASDLAGNLTITTPDGYVGSFTLSVTASSVVTSSHTSATTPAQTLAIDVLDVAPNHAPVASPVILTSGVEDTAYTVTSAALLAGVTDIDGPSLSISAVSIQSGGGSLIDNHDGTWSYTPAANYNGPVQFSYTASDGSLSSSSTASLNLAAVNDAPVIASDTVAAKTITTAISGVSSALTPYGAMILATPGLVSLPGVGFGGLALPAGDDNSSGAIDITSVFGTAGVNFFGHHYTSLYVNNNGNITFGAPTSQFTPSQINAGLNNPIIAAFWADVDTRGAGHVDYAMDAVDGVMTITWDAVGYFSFGSNKVNSFQIVLVNEGNGNFDISYRYAGITWTAGSASGGSGGLGGTPARAGYSAGDGVHYFELPQSGNQAELLMLPTTLGNTGILGVDDFSVRNGDVGTPTLTTSGMINFSDVDLSDIHSSQGVTYTGGGTEIGLLALNKISDTTGTGLNGQFGWTYTANSADVRNALLNTDNGTKVESFDVVISDDHGGSVTQTVSVTLAASNANVLSGGATDWDTPTGWSLSHAPIPTEVAYINTATPVTLAASGSIHLIAGLHVSFGAELDLIAGMQQAFSITEGVSTDSVVNVTGGLEVTGNAVNAGTIDVHAGLLKVDGAMSGGGHVAIEGGTVEFAGASDAKVQFSGASGMLALDDPTHFSGTISGFVQGDTIKLGTTSPTTTAVSNGGGSVDLHYASFNGQPVDLIVANDVAGSPATTHVLQGTSGSDIFIGSAGADNFVFAASSGQDTITNFTHGPDKIDLSFAAPFTGNDASFIAWANTHVSPFAGDTLIHLDANNTVLLKNVASVSASDFIIHQS